MFSAKIQVSKNHFDLQIHANVTQLIESTIMTLDFSDRIHLWFHLRDSCKAEEMVSGLLSHPPRTVWSDANIYQQSEPS